MIEAVFLLSLSLSLASIVTYCTWQNVPSLKAIACLQVCPLQNKIWHLKEKEADLDMFIPFQFQLYIVIIHLRISFCQCAQKWEKGTAGRVVSEHHNFPSVKTRALAARWSGYQPLKKKYVWHVSSSWLMRPTSRANNVPEFVRPMSCGRAARFPDRQMACVY